MMFLAVIAAAYARFAPRPEPAVQTITITVILEPGDGDDPAA
jgi:purine-cytosine permease-like protein